MYIKRNISFEVIWRFGWVNILLFTCYGIIIFTIHHFLLVKYNFQMHIPFSLIGPVGVAVAIYASFKNGQSYDRMWEGRKNWGALSGQSKIFANQIMMYVYDTLPHEAEQMIKRQIALINAHKLQLRQAAPHSKNYPAWVKKYYFGTPTNVDWQNEVASHVPIEEYNALANKRNRALHIMRYQNEQLKVLHKQQVISELQMMEMMHALDACLENMGRNERIKHTPFPRQYAFFSRSFIIIFILLLPFGFLELYEKFNTATYVAMTILFVLVAWLYITMELVSDFSEDPFENFATDVPLTTICDNVAYDLSEIIGMAPQITAKAQNGEIAM